MRPVYPYTAPDGADPAALAQLRAQITKLRARVRQLEDERGRALHDQAIAEADRRRSEEENAMLRGLLFTRTGIQPAAQPLNGR